MAFLSLSKGDPASRKLLQGAIRMRYGVRPQSLDSVWLALSAKQKGFFPTIITATAAYGPNQWRWTEQRRVLFFKRGSLEEDLSKATDPNVIEGFRRVAWAFRALMLTPLAQEGVVLQAVPGRAFQTYHEASPEDVAIVYLTPDDGIAAVEVERYRPSDRKRLQFMIRPEGQLITFNGLIVPSVLSFQWGSEPPFAYTVTDAVPNPG